MRSLKDDVKRIKAKFRVTDRQAKLLGRKVHKGALVQSKLAKSRALVVRPRRSPPAVVPARPKRQRALLSAPSKLSASAISSAEAEFVASVASHLASPLPGFAGPGGVPKAQNVVGTSLYTLLTPAYNTSIIVADPFCPGFGWVNTSNNGSDSGGQGDIDQATGASSTNATASDILTYYHNASAINEKPTAPLWQLIPFVRDPFVNPGPQLATYIDASVETEGTVLSIAQAFSESLHLVQYTRGSADFVTTVPLEGSAQVYNISANDIPQVYGPQTSAQATNNDNPLDSCVLFGNPLLVSQNGDAPLGILGIIQDHAIPNMQIGATPSAKQHYAMNLPSFNLGRWFQMGSSKSSANNGPGPSLPSLNWLEDQVFATADGNSGPPFMQHCSSEVLRQPPPLSGVKELVYSLPAGANASDETGFLTALKASYGFTVADVMRRSNGVYIVANYGAIGITTTMKSLKQYSVKFPQESNLAPLNQPTIPGPVPSNTEHTAHSGVGQGAHHARIDLAKKCVGSLSSSGQSISQPAGSVLAHLMSIPAQINSGLGGVTKTALTGVSTVLGAVPKIATSIFAPVFKKHGNLILNRLIGRTANSVLKGTENVSSKIVSGIDSFFGGGDDAAIDDAFDFF